MIEDVLGGAPVRHGALAVHVAAYLAGELALLYARSELPPTRPLLLLAAFVVVVVAVATLTFAFAWRLAALADRRRGAAVLR